MEMTCFGHAGAHASLEYIVEVKKMHGIRDIYTPRPALRSLGKLIRSPFLAPFSNLAVRQDSATS